MNNDERFRGTIVPEGGSELTGVSKEEAARNADMILKRRESAPRVKRPEEPEPKGPKKQGPWKPVVS